MDHVRSKAYLLGSRYNDSTEKMIRYFLPLLLFCSSAIAAPFYVPIVKFHSGASFITENMDMTRGVRTIPIGKSKTTITRLAYIDSPRQWQELRFKSWFSLVKLCSNVRTDFTPKGYDQLGYMTGILTCNGVDAARKQVEQGFAWVIKRPRRGSDLCTIETKARSAKRGVWGLPEKERPWNDTYKSFRKTIPIGKPACRR